MRGQTLGFELLTRHYYHIGFVSPGLCGRDVVVGRRRALPWNESSPSFETFTVNENNVAPGINNPSLVLTVTLGTFGRSVYVQGNGGSDRRVTLVSVPGTR